MENRDNITKRNVFPETSVFDCAAINSIYGMHETKQRDSLIDRVYRNNVLKLILVKLNKTCLES